MNNSGNPIDLDLVPWNIRDTVDIFGVVWTFTGSWGWVPISSLYPWQNIYAILSPLHRLSLSTWQVSAGNACVELSWVKYFFSTIALSIDQATRSTNCITSVGIDNWWVFSNILVNWSGTVPLTGSWVAPTFYLDGTTIYCNHNTDLLQHRYITFDTTTNLFTDTVSWSANTRHIVGINGMASVDSINSTQATPTWSLMTNSFISWWFTYASGQVWYEWITNPWSSPVWRTIQCIHVATKV